jgi:hypothetical protein
MPLTELRQTLGVGSLALVQQYAACLPDITVYHDTAFAGWGYRPIPSQRKSQRKLQSRNLPIWPSLLSRYRIKRRGWDSAVKAPSGGLTLNTRELCERV